MTYHILYDFKASAPFKVVRNKKLKIFLLPNMIELFETNRMSHFPPSYDDFFPTDI